MPNGHSTGKLKADKVCCTTAVSGEVTLQSGASQELCGEDSAPPRAASGSTSGSHTTFLPGTYSVIFWVLR